MKTVYIQTSAYNAEKTLRRTVDSILSQTYPHFKYYLLDNGSEDRTREIIKEYAAKDERVIPLTRDVNHLLDGSPAPLFSILDSLLSDNSGADYFVNLDADDEYAPDFLEKMLPFMEENDLDVVACGYDRIDTTTGKLISVNSLNENLILEGDLFERHFQRTYPFMRTIWGKVYRTSLLRQCSFEQRNKNNYYGDTLFVLEAFRLANRAGILAESLHRYYTNNQKAASRQFSSKRLASDSVLYKAAGDYLIARFGRISEENKNYLLIIYLGAIRNNLRVIMKANIPLTTKVRSVWYVFTNKTTREVCYNPRALTSIAKKLLEKISKRFYRQKV